LQKKLKAKQPNVIRQGTTEKKIEKKDKIRKKKQDTANQIT
jgi:hypothetical protein